MSQNRDDPVIKFGKHRGLRYSQIPIDYLNWMKREIKSPQSTVDLVTYELKRRKDGTSINKSQRQFFDETTHYVWTHADGSTHDIPIDVALNGKETEIPPF